MKTRQATRQRVQVVFFVALVVVICFLLNVFVRVLGQAVTLDFDMSSEKVLQISDETGEYITALTDDINIYVASPEKDFSTLTAKFLDRYSKLSSRIHLMYVDLASNPGFAQKYSTDGQMDEGSIVVESGKRFTVIPFVGMYVVNPQNQQVVGFKGDQKLTSSILYCLSGDIGTVSFVTGHEEEELPEFRQLVYDAGFRMETVNLLSRAVSETSDLVLIAGPSADFAPDEINRLWTFVNGGGSLMVLHNPTAPPLPNLDAFLAEWGLKANDDVVIDKTNFFKGNPIYVSALFESNEYNTQFSGKNRVMMMPFTGSVDLIYTQRDARKVSAYLSSYEDSYAKASDAQDGLDYAEGDRKGPFTLMALSEQRLYKDDTEVVSRVLLSGSVYFLSDECVLLAGALNGEYGLQLVKTLLGREDSFNVMPRYYDVGVLNLSSNASAVLGAVFSYVLPAAVFLTGAAVLWKRKRV